MSESNTSAVELRSGLELSTHVVAAERDKFPTLMQVLTCYSSEQVTLDVDATDWLAGQVNFRVFRVLHIAQATESHSNVQQPNLPMTVIDQCTPRFRCYP